MTREKSTETKIQEAAKTIFTRKGLAGARMQDIADEAGINKALLHYYYRSKQKLFEMIFAEKLQELFGNLIEILKSDQSFAEKVKAFIKKESELMSEYPSLPIFVLSEAWQNPEFVSNLIEKQPLGALRDQFRKYYEESVETNGQSIAFEHFMINMMSLIIYPIVARPVIKPLFGLNDQDFENLIDERKEIISLILLKNIKRK